MESRKPSTPLRRSVLLGAAHAQAPVTWRFAHTAAVPGTVWHRYATEIVPQRVNDATKGALRINVLSGVVPPGELLNAIKEGTVQGGSLQFPFVGATIPMWSVLSLPGLIPESNFPAAVNKHIAPVVREDARKRFKADPLVISAWPGQYWFSSMPLDSMEKVKGKKLRVAGAESIQLLNAAGGAAVSMPFGELSAALQKGMVDAYTSAVDAVLTSKLYEVTKYATDWPNGMGTIGYLFSTDAIDKLSPHTRKQFLDEMAKINLEVQQAYIDGTVAAEKALKEKGMTFVKLPAAEHRKMTDLAREKVWPEWLKKTGPEGEKLVKAIQAEVK
jgi:TRAP-type transport system periplasmic protein